MSTVEYEVYTDANFIGEMGHGDYQLLLWDIGVHRPGQTRLLCLRVKEEEPSLFFVPPPKAHALICLASLFLRRRLILGSTSRFDDKPVRTLFLADHPPNITFDLEPRSHRYVDEDIVRGPDTKLGELSQWLTLVDNLNTAAREKFISSAKLYAQAVELIEVRPDVSYLNLVSAIETLAKDINIGEPTLNDLRPGLQDLVNKISDLELQQKIVQKLAKEGFLGRKFSEFIKQHIEKDDSFWNYARRPDKCSRVTPESLDRLLKNIYGKRSRALHSGERFPDYIFIPLGTIPWIGDYPEDTFLNKKIIVHHESVEEIPTGTSITSGGMTWKSRDFIPYPHFFERLVNHVLKNYLKSLQVIGGSQE